jgi:predicted nuclease of predicted toxin-antitoxin system
MNLSVEWVAELAQHGWSAVHWSTVGDPRADDAVVMGWALANGYVVFTHDLDFGTTHRWRATRRSRSRRNQARPVSTFWGES